MHKLIPRSGIKIKNNFLSNKVGKFTFYKQLDIMDCGPTCLKMIAKHYGKEISLERIKELSETTKSGSSLKNISNSAEKIGFKTLGVKVNLLNLIKNAPLPCIVFWNQSHFIIVYKIKNKKIYVADPAHGLLVYSYQEFLNNWIGKQSNETTEDGIVLLLEPTKELLTLNDNEKSEQKGFLFLLEYIKIYKTFLVQLAIGLLIASLLQLIFPFLTQSIVDIGVNQKDINFLYLVLLGQLFVFIGKTIVEIMRGWILLHISSRINITLVSDFLIKLMKLPISYFDKKMTGDLLQRIGDHKNIEQLLTNQSLNILFSIFNFLVFGMILAIYDVKVFSIFLVGTIFYFIWISYFFKKRKNLEYNHFKLMSTEQSKVIELIAGMQEIKINNAERQKRWEWEFIQVQLHKLEIKNLRIEQLQSNGASFINELKNIIISFFTAKLVIEGKLTLGMMLSISYIIGQLNAPVSQFLFFLTSLQDAKISLERLSEIHNKENEEKTNNSLIKTLPNNKTIKIENLSFRYSGSEQLILDDLNITIPANKITAIVGASGSGKTTLIKLLQRFYEPNEGKITLGNLNLNSLSHYTWRDSFGSVMQDGYIFNDTIANNIAIGDETIDIDKLHNAVNIANIKDFIETLPLNYNTKIGNEGMGLSGGQKQRILIARAVYKNPLFIFFDEATSALDSNNENIIMNNLNSFFDGRTSIIVAHRLSTVKNADQIIVLDNGKIIETGTHKELIQKAGYYFDLVKNQLDLE